MTVTELGTTIKGQPYPNLMFRPEQSFNGSMKSGKNTPEGNTAVTRLAHNSAERLFMAMTRRMDGGNMSDLKHVDK